MKGLDVENYDGYKGYIGNYRYLVIELGDRKYLYDEHESPMAVRGELIEGLSEKAGKFRVFKIIKEDIENNLARARGIRNKNTLMKIAKSLDRI